MSSQWCGGRKKATAEGAERDAERRRVLAILLRGLCVFSLRALRFLLPLPSLLRPSYAGLEVFASFENQDEIAAIKASAGVEIAQSTRFPAWAGNSLEATFPASGGSLEFSKVPSDWRRQGSLLLFVWSIQPAELKLTLRDSVRSRFVQHIRTTHRCQPSSIAA